MHGFEEAGDDAIIKCAAVDQPTPVKMRMVKRKVKCLLSLAEFKFINKVQHEYHWMYSEMPPHIGIT